MVFIVLPSYKQFHQEPSSAYFYATILDLYYYAVYIIHSIKYTECLTNIWDIFFFKMCITHCVMLLKRGWCILIRASTFNKTNTIYIYFFSAWLSDFPFTHCHINCWVLFDQQLHRPTLLDTEHRCSWQHDKQQMLDSFSFNSIPGPTPELERIWIDPTSPRLDVKGTLPQFCSAPNHLYLNLMS